jgi:hypothetical protein
MQALHILNRTLVDVQEEEKQAASQRLIVHIVKPIGEGFVDSTLRVSAHHGAEISDGLFVDRR